ncbi:hypothetical protein [Lichenihabitans psoromatis]|uniref:hypothetical protein n=1 Tax=Lichenihabitans psoromatis TaxID=2528642 RepID=UPI0010385CEC|nr:hypothetical protein [Lichenihabitans psoromatis]
MWGLITSLLSTVASGIVGPIANVLIKKQDTTLEGFKAAGGYDLEAFKAATAHEEAMARLKIEANAWWGPRLLYMIVGVTAALHTAAIFIDSTFTFGTGHYGNLGIAKLPEVYAGYEQWVVASLFVVSTVGQIPNAVAAWLRK